MYRLLITSQMAINMSIAIVPSFIKSVWSNLKAVTGVSFVGNVKFIWIHIIYTKIKRCLIWSIKT
jgi:hypothetical protein